ncbi:MAG: putative alpha/beta superfamily hydrolase, partial [Gammaproteobacteria bacterium]
MDSLIIKKKSFKMKNLFILLLLSISQISFAQEADTVKTTPFIIGESFSFHSEVLKESRMLNIYLPPAFHPDSAQRYPVIYLLDGSADEDFIHIAGLVNFLNFPWARTMPDAIIVGISNIDRKRDFTYPTTVKKDKKDF